MTSWEGNPRGVVRDNRYFWTNDDGSQPTPWFSGYGSLSVSNNTKDATLDPKALEVVLMSPARLYFRTISWHIIEKSLDGTYLAWCGASSVLPGRRSPTSSRRARRRASRASASRPLPTSGR
jgi:hypothetical protein